MYKSHPTNNFATHPDVISHHFRLIRQPLLCERRPASDFDGFQCVEPSLKFRMGGQTPAPKPSSGSFSLFQNLIWASQNIISNIQNCYFDLPADSKTSFPPSKTATLTSQRIPKRHFSKSNLNFDIPERPLKPNRPPREPTRPPRDFQGTPKDPKGIPRTPK